MQQNYSLTQQGSTAILTIDAPPTNYLDHPEFVPAENLSGFLSINSSMALIICGAGRHFSAGGNLTEISRLAADKQLPAAIAQGNQLLAFIENLEIPVIAAIEGVCFGGGLEVALACTIRIASEKALFAFPESNHGLIPGLGGLVRLARHAPALVARVALSGEIVPATEALSYGLVNQLEPKGNALTAAINLAHQLTNDRSPRLINYTMRVLNSIRTHGEAYAISLEAELFAELAKEADLSSFNN